MVYNLVDPDTHNIWSIFFLSKTLRQEKNPALNKSSIHISTFSRFSSRLRHLSISPFHTHPLFYYRSGSRFPTRTTWPPHRTWPQRRWLQSTRPFGRPISWTCLMTSLALRSSRSAWSTRCPALIPRTGRSTHSSRYSAADLLVLYAIFNLQPIPNISNGKNQ